MFTSDFYIKKHIPKGMLLYGPPGTGKTMLAKAFAHEAKLPFISVAGQDMLDSKVMEQVFQKARKYAPSIVFIDEIDVFRHRNRGFATDILVTKLLTLIDGFKTSQNPVFIIAATNLYESIDSALIRSGRIDLHINVPYLDREARGFFVDKYLENERFDAQNIDKEKILAYTSNMSGADLQKVEREAILYIIREDIPKVDQQILIETINTVKYGQRIASSRQTIEETQETAYHEASHAVISHVLIPDRKIEQISIVGRADAAGFVSYEGDEHTDLSKDYIENRICVLLAGRAAQIRQFGTKGIDAGVSSDLQYATHLAYLAISKFGMGEGLENISIDYFRSQKIALFEAQLENKISKWLDELSKKTEQLVQENWTMIEKVALELIEKEIIDNKEFQALLDV